MGRKPKNAIVEEEKKIESPIVEQSEDDELTLLKKQLEMLQKQIANMQQSKSQPEPQNYEEPRKEERIDGREYIKIMSLSNIPLNLTTEPMGRGRLFQFSKFGEVKKIMYDDVIKIVYNHPTFMQKGRFLIMDARVVKELGYDDDYDKILTKAEIEKILNSSQDAIDLYKVANDIQKKIIQELLVRKVRDDLASVDTGLVIAIKKISGVDLIAEAEQIKFSALNQAE